MSVVDRLLRRRRRQRDVAAQRRALDAAARQNARELCALWGPWRVAADYGAMPEASLEEIAVLFARTAFSEDVREAAAAGAREGFDDWLAGNPHDPYD